ncbi:MAG: hypothetical protein EOP06_01840 [Proteobacteria bacterium]|nr:MAG: hypothetical protein EOP06_01840 [Pseudomonadota bacterium]
MTSENRDHHILLGFSSIGFLLGIVFLAIAVILTAQDENLSFLDVFKGQQRPLCYLIDFVPFALGIVGFLFGKRELKLRKLQADKSKEQLEAAEIVGEYGSWSYNLKTGESSWSNGLYKLLEIEVGDPLRQELFNSFCAPEEVARSLENAKALAEGRILQYDEMFLVNLRSGRTKCIRAKGGILQSSIDPSVRSIVGTTRDVTSLVNAQEEAKTAQAALARVEGVNATIITYKHEINTPLTVALGSLELLEERIGKQREIENSVQALMRIADLLKNLDAIASEGKVNLAPYAGIRNLMLEIPKR